jgi:hypothetical protein
LGVQIYDDVGNALPTELDDDIAWARVSLPPATIVTLQVGFGPVPAQPGPVWADTYEGVWHLSGGVNVHDSSIHARLGVAVGTATKVGMLGKARTFGGTIADYITVVTAAPIALSTMTASAWVNFSTVPVGTDFVSLLTREHLDTASDDFYLGADPNGYPIGNVWTNQSYSSAYNTALSTGYWVHLVTVYDGSSVTVYEDTVSATPTVVVAGAVSATNAVLYLGCDRNNFTGVEPPAVPDTNYLDGALDEVRLESVARPPDWLGFEDHAMRDQVITYGGGP